MADMQKITVTGLDTYPAAGQTVAILSKGIDQYEGLSQHIGETVQAVSDKNDGRYVEGVLITAKVGALVDLINEFGSNNIHTQGRPYSPLSLIQTLSRVEGGGSLDVTKLYTALTLRVDRYDPNIQSPQLSNG